MFPPANISPRSRLWLSGCAGLLALFLFPAGVVAQLPQPTPHLIEPPRPITAASANSTPSPQVLVQSNNHYWLFALSWVPLVLLTLFGRYMSKREGRARWISPADAVPAGASATVPSSTPTMDAVSWAQFELVIAECYRRQGYEVEVSAGYGADGGIDVKLSKPGELALVQCKQWKTYKVPVQELRAFFGVLTAEGAQRGYFVSTGGYTRDCRLFGEGKPIELLGRVEIERMVAAVQSPGENLWAIAGWLPAFVQAARISTPACPKCGQPMTLRHSDQKPPFWGCPGYPRCHGKREARLELLRFQSY